MHTTNAAGLGVSSGLRSFTSLHVRRSSCCDFSPLTPQFSDGRPRRLSASHSGASPSRSMHESPSQQILRGSACASASEWDAA
eukprot:4994986-Prymnesium_polylepis.1